MKTKLSYVWFGRDCGWRWEREKDHGEEGKEGWRKTTNGATASEGKKSGSSISEILQGLGPSSSFGEVDDVDVFLSLACNYLSACAWGTLSKGLWKLEDPRALPLKAPFLSCLQIPTGQKRIPGPCCSWDPLFFKERE